LEIIFIPKSFWERVKSASKKFVISLPGRIVSLIGKIFTVFLTFMGFGSVKSIVWKLLPGKMVIQSLITLIMLFFPALAPIIGIGKMMI
jgi:hypothetical protein